MGGFPRIPFNPTASVTSITGLAVGQLFSDASGRVFRLARLATSLTASATVANSLLLKTSTGLATDVVANGVDASYPVPHGVCLSSVAAVSEYVLLGIKGRFTSVVSTGTVNAGDSVAASTTTKAVSGNAESTAVTYRLLKGSVGTALAAASGNVVDLDINIT